MDHDLPIQLLIGLADLLNDNQLDPCPALPPLSTEPMAGPRRHPINGNQVTGNLPIAGFQLFDTSNRLLRAQGGQARC